MTRLLRALACGCSGLLVLMGLLSVAPAHARAAAATVSASRTAVLAGEKFTVTVRTGTKVKRPVVLQYRTGARWRTIRTTTNSSGAVRVTRSTKAARTYFRARVPAATIRGTKYRSVATKRIAVKTVKESVTATVRIDAGRVRVTGTTTPARKGRAMSLQRLDGTTWRTLIAGRAGNAKGRVDFGDVGSHEALAGRSFRVKVGTWKGAKAVLGRATTVAAVAGVPAPPGPQPGDEPRDEPADEPTPEPIPEPIPVTEVSVETAGPRGPEACTQIITTKTTYVNASLTLRDRRGGRPTTVKARLRVRGNSTSSIERKRPYKVKLDTRTSLLGMPASKDWVLLANHFDRSLLRNDVAMRTARVFGAPWAPRLESVDLRINGALCGVYQFGEGIEAEPGRVELGPDDTLLEADTNDDTDPQFRTDRGLRVFLKDGDERDVPSVSSAFQEVEDLLYDESFPNNGYRDRIDVDSFVTMYLTNELTKNIDAGFRNSVYLVMRADGTLAMGPPWDYDFSQGMYELGYAGDVHLPTGWWIGRLFHPQFPDDDWRAALLPSQLWREPGGHYYNRLLADPWFVEQVRDRWREVLPQLRDLPEHVAAETSRLLPSARANFTLTEDGGAGQLVWAAPEELEVWTSMIRFVNAVDSGVEPGEGWLAEATHLRDWLSDRIDWMDEQFGTSGD
ncbi:CotH kinase family protein [Aeromicrobium duanguangcaii]|uniref:CotH kinase family protein n=1 Tax=Aeromicrobium duanguangcaii TaxID=2968086 RepID=A0ABY5KAE1_9ACTN|nr:CotH kinase family protein [Aeromicrobium duanguangcaii]UUI67392.1 CotH kinase family protein [Aeromicrobium duanguangcaii]